MTPFYFVMSNAALHVPHILKERYCGELKNVSLGQRTCWGSRGHENKRFCIVGMACKKNQRLILSVQLPSSRIKST